MYYHCMKFRKDPQRDAYNEMLNEFRQNAFCYHVVKSELRKQLKNGAEKWIDDWCKNDVARRAGNWFFKDVNDMLKFKLVWDNV